MFKRAKIIPILLLVVILIAAFFRHTFCRFLIEKAAAKSTGLRVSIEELNLDILNNNLYMRGITLLNPPGFNNEVLGRAEEIFIKYDLWGSLGGRLHLRLLKASINEINIIRDAKGGSNVSALREAENPTRTLTATTVKSSPKKKKQSKFLIDRLELSLEKATFMDYKAEIGQPAVIILTLEGPCVFKNVSDLGYVTNSVSIKGGFKHLLDNLSGVIGDGGAHKRKKKAQES